MFEIWHTKSYFCFALFSKCYLNLSVHHWLLIWIDLIFLFLFYFPVNTFSYVLFQCVKDLHFSKTEPQVWCVIVRLQLLTDLSVTCLNVFLVTALCFSVFCPSWFCVAAAFILFEKSGFLSSVHLCVCPYKILYAWFYGVTFFFRYLLMSCNNTEFSSMLATLCKFLSFMPTIALSYEKFFYRSSDVGITVCCLVHRHYFYLILNKKKYFS